MKKVNIQPLTRFIIGLITKSPPKQPKQHEAFKQNNKNNNLKEIPTIQTEKMQATEKIKQQNENYYNQNYSTIPLPIKTTLFEKAQFLYRESASKGTEPTEITRTLLIKLETLNLGKLWISVTFFKNSLLVKFFNKDKKNIELIKENLPLLKREISESNFKKVSFKYQVCNEVWLYNNVLKDFLKDYAGSVNFKI